MTGNFIKYDTKKNYKTDIKYKKTFLGYQPKQGVHNYRIVSDGKILADKYYTIGKNNFRITPRIDDIKKNKTINFFGGSFTFGYHLNDDETLPYLAQKYFNNWKINNYGVSGYGAHQMLAHIQKYPEIIKEINILVTDYGHVPRSSCLRHFSFGTPKFILDDNKQLKRLGNCQFGIMDKIPLPKIVGSIINRSEIKNYISSIITKNDYFDKNSVELYLSIIKKINDIIIKNEKKFFVGYMDNSNQINKDIIKELIKNKIYIIDLSLDKNKKEYWLPDKHTTKEGNEKRATIIYNYLKKIIN